MDDFIPAVTTSLRFAQIYRKHLEEVGVLDRRFRLQRQSDATVALPILPGSLAQQDLATLQDTVAPGSSCSLSHIQAPVPSKRCSVKSANDKLVVAVRSLLEQREEVWSEELLGDLPHSWHWHGDLALLGEGSFNQHIWKKMEPEIWEAVALALGVKRLARVGRVSTDGYRTPVVTMLLGDDSWVSHVDNGIRYEFDVTKCMFSPGNITEKLRIASFDCRGETVVDLYAGIGYFTLPYLVHAGAADVHACEWNPHAVRALQRNLELNGVSTRCQVHQGDNRELPLCDIADRVNLGLIPSSEEGWPVACRLLKKDSGGILHIHQNMTSRPQHSETPEACLNSPVGNILDSSGNRTNAEFSRRKSTAARNCGKPSQMQCSGALRRNWQEWAESTSCRIASLLLEVHGHPWRTCVQHIEHIKSYAPHVDHVVLDLECRPA
ncbi:tRNA wybutosine-synthesizing protein 2 homolog isoform X2 [Amia ocellicauda]|uniref:tRNA wybutosine-synthesizing protein 2 homolog isoform X2 n=1 Tax=Amia ocellicauda TaxID=2972642 RepID=UPI003463BEEE